MAQQKTSQFRLINTRAEHAEAASRLDRVNFPTFDAGEALQPDMIRHHLEIFPEGQFVIVVDAADGTEKVIATSASFRTSHTPDDTYTDYLEFTGQGWFSGHDPQGEWIYGVMVSVLPEYRGHGIGRLVYDARRDLVKRLNVRGEIVAGLIPGYENHRYLSIEAYVADVIDGKLFDPTLSVQVRNGFTVHRILQGYVSDPRSNGYCSLLTRLNPHYSPVKT